MLTLLILCSLLGDGDAGAQDKTPTPPPAQTPPAEKPAEPFFRTLIQGITLDGQMRLRAEYRDPTVYNNTGALAPAQFKSDDQFLTRIRVNLKFSVTDDVDVFVQPQDQRVWGQELSVLNDERNFDLHQGYAEIRNLFGEPLTIKAGRMELSYGDQRLVSPLDWSNIGRAWDGAKIKYGPKDWWIEGFYTVIKDPLSPIPAAFPAPATAINGAAEDQDFFGVYFSYVGVKDHEFDAYVFGRQFRDNSFASEVGAVPGDLQDRTYGARMKGKAMGFDYTVEAMGQSGRISTDRVNAYAYAATLGYTFDLPATPRIGVEYDFASGDRNPTDGKRNTFDPLFPFGHYYQGFADVFAFKNGKDLSLYLKAAPTDSVTVQLDFHNFWLARDRDAWYNAAGTAIRRDATGAADTHVGAESDLHARVNLGKNVKFWAGWSHFFAGPFVRQTPGRDVDMNWVFLQMTIEM